MNENLRKKGCHMGGILLAAFAFLGLWSWVQS